LFKSEFNMAKKLQKDKALFINKKNNKVWRWGFLSLC
jgi:hypothetical protein